MSTMQIWSHWSTPISSSWFKPSGMWLYMVETYNSWNPKLGPPKKFQYLTRAGEVVITRLRIGHTNAKKANILSRGPPIMCHYCGQTLTIDHMLLECAVLRESREEYYTADSLNTRFETIPETCIVEFQRETGFFYLIWTVRYSIQSLTWTIPKLKRFINFMYATSNVNGHISSTTLYLNQLATDEILNLTAPDLFEEDKQIWDNPTCEGRLIYPEGCVPSLNKSNPIHGECIAPRSLMIRFTGIMFISGWSGLADTKTDSRQYI